MQPGLLPQSFHDGADEQRTEQALGHGPQRVDAIASGGDHNILAFQKWDGGKGAGGPLAVLFIAIIAAECGKAVSKETKVFPHPPLSKNKKLYQ